MLRPFTLILTIVFGSFVATVLWSQNPEDRAEDISKRIDELASKMPRIPASTPEDSLKKLVIHPDFEVQIVATEPLIRDPGAIDIDEYQHRETAACFIPSHLELLRSA